MYYLLILLISTLLTTTHINKEVILEGQNIVNDSTGSTQLISNSVKLLESMKIIKAEGNCDGFWIQKTNITIHKFKKPDKAVGTVLKPGVYTVYPEISKDKSEAKIKLTLREI